MAIDDDIAASLPPPPPAAPARRDAAIAMAMRRFDGVDDPDTLRPAARRTDPRAPWWARFGRPQAGALVSVALVALIGLPAAWMSLDGPSDSDVASRAPAVSKQSPTPEAMAARPPADAVPDTEAPAFAAADSVTPTLGGQPPKSVELVQTEDATPLATAAPPPPPAAIVAEMAGAPLRAASSNRLGSPRARPKVSSSPDRASTVRRPTWPARPPRQWKHLRIRPLTSS